MPKKEKIYACSDIGKNVALIIMLRSNHPFSFYSSGSTWAASSKKHNKKPRLDDDSTDDDDSDDGVMDDMLEFFENSDRKQAGLGLVGKFFGEGPPQSRNWKPKLVIRYLLLRASGGRGFFLGITGIDPVQADAHIL